MSFDSIWISGSTRSGKTAQLIEAFYARTQAPSKTGAIALVFAATGDNRLDLADRIAIASGSRSLPSSNPTPLSFKSTTPLGFFQDEVSLFYPLLVQKLGLISQFPLRLRPETEQELATRFWQAQLAEGQFQMDGVSDYYLVRRLLDILQLAASSGIPPEEIPVILTDGIGAGDTEGNRWDVMADALRRWRSWCLERGILTYGIITELYWRYLLPDETYQQHLYRRYQSVFADDVDEYPAIAHDLFTRLLDQGIPGVFTYNPYGSVRLGLGADPQHLADLANRCQVQSLDQPVHSLGALWGTDLVQWISEPMLLPTLPDPMRVIQTPSRAQLLRDTAEIILAAIHSGVVQPQEVAVIGPGVDAIARYTLREILTNKGIPVEVLNDQRPLYSSPRVRALLTLLALVYPGLGRLLHPEAIAEMLIVLSQPPATQTGQTGLELAGIDPVRAGLLTDHCFAPDPDHPRLLPVTDFPRWDRLGYRATQSYTELRQWLDNQIQQQQQRLIPNPVALLDRAIQQFLQGGSHLPYDQLAVIRELMETAQHYWQVDARLRQSDRLDHAPSVTVGQFIQLLRDGTITADPYPVRPLPAARQAVTLSTIFQYRSNRLAHRWHFWLDAGSPFWLTGGTALFSAPLFLKNWSGRLWTVADELAFNQQRLQRQILDLVSRISESDPTSDLRLYLCHSEMATNGQEQNGPLLTLVNAIHSQR